MTVFYIKSVRGLEHLSSNSEAPEKIQHIFPLLFLQLYCMLSDYVVTRIKIIYYTSQLGEA